MSDYLGQIVLLLAGILIQFAVPLFIPENRMRRFVRWLGAITTIAAIGWMILIAYDIGYQRGESVVRPTEFSSATNTATNAIPTSTIAVPLPTATEQILNPIATPSPTISPVYRSTPVHLGTSLNGTISAGELDIFSFTRTDSSSGRVWIYVQPVNSALCGQVTYKSEEVITNNCSSSLSISYNFSLVFAPESNIEYLIIIRGENSISAGSYILSISEGQ